MEFVSRWLRRSWLFVTVTAPCVPLWMRRGVAEFTRIRKLILLFAERTERLNICRVLMGAFLSPVICRWKRTSYWMQILTMSGGTVIKVQWNEHGYANSYLHVRGSDGFVRWLCG